MLNSHFLWQPAVSRRVQTCPIGNNRKKPNLFFCFTLVFKHSNDRLSVCLNHISEGIHSHLQITETGPTLILNTHIVSTFRCVLWNHIPLAWLVCSPGTPWINVHGCSYTGWDWNLFLEYPDPQTIMGADGTVKAIHLRLADLLPCSDPNSLFDLGMAFRRRRKSISLLISIHLCSP